MRGYVQKQESTGLRFSVKYYCICEVAEKPRDGFQEITVPNPSTGKDVSKYIKPYDTVDALITKIEFRDTKDQYPVRYMSWRIFLRNAENQPAVLELPFKSNASERFMKCAENIDYTRPVEFRAWKDGSGDKDKTAFYIGQRVNEADEKSVKVEQKYKQGAMGDCPGWVEELDGWSSAAQKKFLHGRMIDVVIPRVEAANAMRDQRPEHEEESDPFAEDDGTEDF